MEVVLVTGGTGLVGNGIRLALQSHENENRKWIFLSSNMINLCNRESTIKYFEEVKPTHVIHLAAKVGGLFSNMKDNLDFFRQNMQINDNVLQASLLCGARKVISCLSTCVFPDKTTYPIDETMLHDGPPHESNFGYSYAKRMLDVLNKAYMQKHNVLFTSIIPTNIFGPFDNFNIECGHVIPGLIHKAYLAKESNQPLCIYGSGKPLRQLLYSLDLGRLILWVLDHYNQSDPIILAPPESGELSIGEVGQTVARLMQCTEGAVAQHMLTQFDTSKEDGQFRKTANSTKLRSLFPDFKFTPFEQAMEETCAWFRENYTTARR